MHSALLPIIISCIVAESGIFEFYVDGKIIGEERYNIEGRMLESTVTLSNGYIFSQKTLFDIDGEPDTYVIEGIIKNVKVKLDIKRMNAKFAYTAISEKNGTEHFAVPTKADRHIILDNFVASQYLYFIPKIKSDAKNEFKVFTPQDGKIRDVIIKPASVETKPIGSKKGKYYHLTFQLKKDRTVDLWIDSISNRLIRIDIRELKLKILHKSK